MSISVELISQLLEPGLVHVDKSTAAVQLVNHLGRMLDQIAVLLFEGPHLYHPLFDLRKGPLKIRGHLVERIGQSFNFVPGLEFQPPLQPSAADFLHAAVQQLDGPGDPSRCQETCSPQHGQHEIHRAALLR